MTNTTVSPAAVDLCRKSLSIMSTGDLPDFKALFHPDATNREAADEPPDCRGTGPAAFYATTLWLRSAFADLRWEIHDAVHSGDTVVLHTTMSGRQIGPFVNYGQDSRVTDAMPSNGRTFAVTQSHWYRLADGLIIEHWANRDDIGMAKQLGWVPPTPRYLIRMALAKRRMATRSLGRSDR